MNDTPDEPVNADEMTSASTPGGDPPPKPENGNGKTATIDEQVRRARESIPVGDHGVTPTAYEHQVTIAKDRSKAYLMLPTHLHNNAPVLAGLVGIAARFNLDPLMLASQTYVPPGSNKLAFQSQAFGAILYGSGLLRGRLRFNFHGEGEDMTCTVSGTFKDDPDTTCSATTPPLKLLHPGYSKKEGMQHMVKGSPLWDKDPEQQLAYFAQRRWIRRYAPDACMGMYTPEEIQEIDEYRADRAGAITLDPDRLGQLDTGEGWSEGTHLDADLAAIAPEPPNWPMVEPEPEPEPPPSPPRPARRKPVQAKKPAARGRAAPAPKTRPSKPGRAKGRPPSRAVIQAAVKRAEKPPRRAVAQAPRWLDYVGKADTWIKAGTDPEVMEKRWDDERDLRDDLLVPMGERSRLRAMLDRRLAVLRPRPMKPEGEDE